jgi:hypothetical protein
MLGIGHWEKQNAGIFLLLFNTVILSEARAQACAERRIPVEFAEKK